jgi:hypothetical protein
MHPEHPALPQYLNSSIKIGGMTHLVTEMQAAFSWFKDIAAGDPNIEVRQIRSGFMSHQIVKSDTTMLLAILLYSHTTSRYPLLECSRSSPLFQAAETEFNALWSANAPDGAAAPTPADN